MTPQQDFQHSAPTFGELIGRQGLCFYVPTYQRGFTWGSDQIERLFEDLFAGTDRVAAGDNSSTFLGSVIFFADKYAVDPKRANALPTEVFHVVDGQQRLTTLLLVCSSLMRAAHQVLTELDATQVTDSDPDPTTTWLREILQAVSGRLLGALHFDDERAENGYRFKPRMIRQASDIWGNTVTDARYESDIAWYLHAIATARAETSAYEPVAVSPHRPHLRLALEAIESALAAVQTGDTDCAALSRLAFVTSDEACGRLLDRPEGAPVGPSCGDHRPVPGPVTRPRYVPGRDQALRRVRGRTQRPPAKTPTHRQQHGLLQAQAVARADAEGLCGLCSRRLPEDMGRVEVDHIVRVRDGGTSTIDNLQAVHRSCNQRKG